MVKKEVILVVLVLLLLFSLYNVRIKYIHEKGMEKVTIENIIDMMTTVSVSILIEADPPNVVIDSPENTTYSSGINITLNYIASDANGVDSVWYNLDNGENTTVTGNTTFSTSDGSHTLYMFANDSNNNLNDSKFVNFFIGNPYEEESDDNRDGEIEFSDETINRLLVKLSNLPSGSSANTTLYNQTIPSDWETPSSNVVESVLHYFEINVNESTSGGSYNIYFNLSSAELGSISANDISAFIYENGNWGELSTAVIDSSSDPISFSAVTTHFSDFLIGKRAATTPPTGQAAGGVSAGAGGAGVSIPELSFSIDQEFLKISVKKNELLKKQIKITNTGSSLLDLIIDLQELKMVISISENSFKLKPGEEKIIDLNLLTGIGVAPGVYVGSILIKAGEQITKLVKTIIEIESERVLFDISLDIPLRYQTVNPGDEFLVQSTLLNLGGLSDVDVSIEYQIKNSKGETILKEEETVKVGTQASFTKKFIIPDDIALGEYVVIAVVKYQDSVGTSSEAFNIGAREAKETFLYFIGIGLVVMVGMVLYLVNSQRKRLKSIGRLQKKIQKSAKSSLKKIGLNEEQKKELEMLEKSYKEGYITKDAYKEAKEGITKGK